MDKYKSFTTIPLKPGQEDTKRTRIERWEEAKGIPIKTLPHNEWIREMSRTFVQIEQ